MRLEIADISPGNAVGSIDDSVCAIQDSRRRLLSRLQRAGISKFPLNCPCLRANLPHGIRNRCESGQAE